MPTDDNSQVDPAFDNPNNPGQNDAPPDPSNTTSKVGQKVEQGVISKHKGISEQSAEWEDAQERQMPKQSSSEENAENYLKNPSPEEFTPGKT